MEKFEDTKREELQQIETLEKTIAALLEHMSKNINRQTNLPSQTDVKEIKDDLNYKKGLVENAETTYARLKVELEQRNNDLEKINNLDVKITKEMKTVTEKLDGMQGDMENKFTNVDQIKSEYDQEKTRLINLKKKLQCIQDGLANQITFHSMKHDKKKNQILQNELYNVLNDLEKKVIGNETNIFSCRQFIDAKGAESNYQVSLNECMNVVSEMNMDIINWVLKLK